jgi:hypothetical protein
MAVLGRQFDDFVKVGLIHGNSLVPGSRTNYGRLFRKKQGFLVADEICLRADSKWWIDVGQYLGISEESDALGHISDAIRERNLAPTAFREIEEKKAAKKRERQEKEQRDLELANALAKAIADDMMTWNAADDSVTSTVLGHALRYSGSGIYGTVTVDGATLSCPCGLLTSMLHFRNEQARQHALRIRKELADSFRGVSVSDVRKVKQTVTVTTSDGRVLEGKSARDGWTLAAVRTANSYTVQYVDSDHPEIARLASEAKAWAKAQQKARA